MTIDLIKFASIGGEVSENYFGRSDLAKFDLSLAVAENWFVDYHGGLSTSPGLEFVDYVLNDEYPTKFFTFKFSSTVANTNVILFGKDYIRFLQDGAYVLETEQVISTITQASPGVATIVGHGWTTGDWIKLPSVGEMLQLAGKTIKVVVLTANTVELYDVFGNPIDTSAFTAYVGGGTAARIYTLISPYDVDDLAMLRSSQIRDTVRFTHNAYPVYNLIRNDSADWTLEEESFINDLERVGTVTFTQPGGNDNVAAAYIITQVNDEGVESLASDHQFELSMNDTFRSATLRWTPLAGAKYYNIYKSRLTNAATSEIISRAFQVGYIGQSRGAHFFDRNITPDFARTPPVGNNPFANGAIIGIDVTAGGANYSNASTISVSDATGTGFIGYVMVGTGDGSPTGPVVGINIVDGGQNYTAPSFTISVGTGATVEAVLREADGNNPAVTAVHQQRQVYAATDNHPLTFFGSRPGRLSNFTISDILLANDSYEHDLDSEDASPIRNIVSVRGGLLLFTPAGIYLASGTNNASISATDVQAEPQSSQGASFLPPLKVNTDVLYCESNGGRVMQLAYNDVIKLYAGLDLSLLASHMFSAEKQVTAWTYAAEPFKLIWARRSDGVMINFTIIKEQEVYAFTRRLTRGSFEDVISLDEASNTTVYTMVSRTINGRRTKFIEKVASRNFQHVEDAFCVDCGLRLGSTYPDSTMQLAAGEGEGIELTTALSVFGPDDEGKFIHFGVAKMSVETFVNPNKVLVNFVRDLASVDYVSFTTPAYPRLALSGEWTLDQATMTVSGLDHLEGEAVAVLADGNVINGLTVTNGSLTLPTAATRVIVGLPYTCTAKNLPITVDNNVVEDKAKRVAGIGMRVKDTRGLKFGTSLENLYEMKERTFEAYAEPTELQNGMRNVLVEPIWSTDATAYFVQDQPLPATVLGYILNIEVGDDPN